jgi:hypothetical protein
MAVMARSKLTAKQLEQAVLAQLVAQAPPKPPKTFDPLKASAEELLKYALPRKPPRANQAAYKIWKLIVGTAVSQGNRVRSAGYGFVTASDYGIGSPQPNFLGAQETSHNWSGIVARSVEAPSFTQIYGVWQMPAISAPIGVGKRSYRCSTWIGLDGHDPTSPAMPQIGVTLKVDTGIGSPGPTYEPWVQWWSRKFSAEYKLPPQVIQGFTIKQGHVIACVIDVKDPWNVNVTITNQTTSTSKSQPLSGIVTLPPPYQTISIPLGPVSGTTAEWIAERPARIKNPTALYQLPVFDTVTFSPATVQKPPLLPGPVSTIRMVDPVARPRPELLVLSRARRDYAPNGTQMMTVGPGLERAIGG